jgi:hypothetical protein
MVNVNYKNISGLVATTVIALIILYFFKYQEYLPFSNEIINISNHDGGTTAHLFNLDKSGDNVTPSSQLLNGNTDENIKKIAKHLENIDKSTAGINKSAKVASDITYYATVVRTTTYLITFCGLIYWFVIR